MVSFLGSRYCRTFLCHSKSPCICPRLLFSYVKLYVSVNKSLALLPYFFFRELSLSMTGTGAEANLQGCETIFKIFVGVLDFFQ